MITVDGARAAVAGAVTLANVNALLDQGTRLFKAPSLTVDLAGVTDVDSTAVSLLLEWRRAARREQRAIDYINYPANLKSLIQLYGVADLLGA